MKALALAACLSFSFASAMPYNRSGAASYAMTWADHIKKGHDGCTTYFEEGGNCCKFI